MRSAIVIALLVCVLCTVSASPNVTIKACVNDNCTGDCVVHHAPTYQCENAVSHSAGSETLACPIKQKCVYFGAHSGDHCSGPAMSSARVCNICNNGRSVQCLPNGDVMFMSNCSSDCSHCTYVTTASTASDRCFNGFPGDDFENWLRIDKVADCNTVTDSWWHGDRCNGTPDTTMSFPTSVCVRGVEVDCDSGDHASYHHVHHKSFGDLPRHVLQKLRGFAKMNLKL